jgi:hypothetical protein
MWLGVPILDSGQRGHHHLHKSDPSRDLSSGFGLRFWGRQLLNPMIDGMPGEGVAPVGRNDHPYLRGLKRDWLHVEPFVSLFHYSGVPREVLDRLRVRATCNQYGEAAIPLLTLL